jgi:exopolyphosphatase/guanosine-5'-triphosphate,3'-diphosphate pyrophosphatase
MGARHFGLYEMGSNSLKFYVVDIAAGDAGALQVHKFPWRVAHEYYAEARVSAACVEQIVDAVRAAQQASTGVPLAASLAIATGVFREIPAFEDVAERVAAATGVRMRLISGADEAALMARGLRQLAIPPPALLCDLGGSSLEWALGSGHGRPVAGSLPLGAIRNAQRFAGLDPSGAEYLRVSAAACDAVLAAVPVNQPVSVVATGGTAQVVADLVGDAWVGRSALVELIAAVQRHGPPPQVKETRRPVLLPGLVILWRVVERCQAEGLRHGAGAVREGMVRRLLQLLEKFPPDELRATQLLHRTRSSHGRPGKSHPGAG